MRFLRPDSYLVWDSEEISERLSWYRSVMLGESPPKYVIARSIEVESLDGDLEELLEVHSETSEEFKEVLNEIKEGKNVKLKEVKNSYLDLKVLILKKILSRCELCERKCGANRKSGEIGICKVPGDGAYVDSYFLHMGEEAPLVPSGTIFYKGCNFKCVYCQNWSISQEAFFRSPHDPVKLSEIQEKLRRRGSRNVNHVGGDPTPHLPFIVESMKYLKERVPQLWNSNMYLSEISMKILKDLIDIWVPDFKYGNDQCAKRLSLVDRYFEVITRNLRELEGEDVIVRHLVLPGHLKCCTFKVIDWLSSNLRGVVLNLMDQYRPEYLVERNPRSYPEISRIISSKEMEDVIDYAISKGWEGPVYDLWYYK